ncbi:MAG: TonB-dependent receptor, partial [Acidobacteria bacterium]|nr:TonB-dependent receptor [Acidobacteriota bacterium]
MKLLATFWTAGFLTIAVAAQSGARITGAVVIYDAPAKNAKVTLRDAFGAEISTTVDAEGRYVFAGVRDGNYWLVAAAGTLQTSRQITVAAEQQLTIELDLSVVDDRLYRGGINELVTISADELQPIRAVSKTIDVISGQEMRDRADFALIDSLRTIPGLRVQQLGGFGRAASVKTRGLRNQDTAVLVDGIRFRDAAFITGDASSFLSDFTLTSVSRVEVLRGSGSSLYGTNAIGGVVDFQTPRPSPGFHGQISGAVGGLGLGRFRANVSDGTSDRKFGFNLGISRTAYTKGIDGNDDAHNTNFQSRLDYQPFSRTNLSGRFFVSDAYVRLNSSPDTFGTPPVSNAVIINAVPGVNFLSDADDPDDTQDSKFFNVQFVLTHVFSPKLSLQASYSGLKTARKNNTGPLGLGFGSTATSFFDGTIQTANAHFDWSPVRINKLTAGYEIEHEKFGNDGQAPSGFGNFFTRAFQTSNTFYVQDLLSLDDGRLNLAGGFRIQRFSLYDPTFSVLNAPYTNLSNYDPPTAYTFDASAAYTIRSTGTKLRAHVGNGYRVPSLFERYGTFFSTFEPEPAFVALGDPNLKPEKSIAFDAGIEQPLASRAHVTATYFYTRLTDIIGFGNSVPAIGSTTRPFGGYENQEGGIARGAEFSGRLSPFATTDIFTSYTFTNSDQLRPQVSGSGVFQTLGNPDHQFT